MTDLRSEIANLRELNAKRTLGEWSVVRDRDNHWGMVEVTGPGVCGRLVIGFTVSTNVDSRRAQQIEADAELIAALANACDAGLLDAAERGVERTPPTGVIVMSTPEEWQAYGAGRDSMKEEANLKYELASKERQDYYDALQKANEQLAAKERDSKRLDYLDALVKHPPFRCDVILQHDHEDGVWLASIERGRAYGVTPIDSDISTPHLDVRAAIDSAAKERPLNIAPAAEGGDGARHP